MADIKTRDVDRSMKFKDAAAGLPKELVRDLALKTGDAFRSGSSASGFEPESMSEDAGNRMEKGMEWTADHGTRSVWSAGKKAAGTAARKWKDRDQADSLETETSSAGKTYAEGQENRPSPAEKRESLKKQGSSAEPSPENGKDPRTLKTRERIEDGKKELERSGRTLKDTGKELKTAGKAARQTGYANGDVQEAAIAKEQSKRAYQAGKQLVMQGKQAVKTGAKGAKKVFQGAKTAVRTAVTAVRSVIGLVSAGAVVIFSGDHLRRGRRDCRRFRKLKLRGAQPGSACLYRHNPTVCFGIRDPGICSLHSGDHDAGERRQRNRSHAGQRVPLQYGISQYTGRDHRPGLFYPGGNPVLRRLRHPGRVRKSCRYQQASVELAGI